MSVLGISRRLSKLLPPLVQILVTVFILHLITKGLTTRVRRQLHRSSPTPLHDKEMLHSPNGIAENHIVHPNLALRQQRSSRLEKIEEELTKAKLRQRRASLPTTTTRPLPDFDGWRRNIQLRIDHMHMECTRLGLGLWKKNSSLPASSSNSPLPPAYRALFVTRDRNLTFCPVSGSGSNKISKQLLALTGEFSDRQLTGRLPDPPSVVARHRYPFLPSWELYPLVLQRSVNFVVVRHPFDRLLHYFRRSLENSKKNPSEFVRFGRKIVNKYRKFPMKRKEPTFNEFVQFLIDLSLKSSEEHWLPVAVKCTPCHIPYTVIGRYETMWQDVTYAFKMANLKTDSISYFDDDIIPEIRQRYFAQVNRGNLHKLYAKYKLDFELFGYSMGAHLAYSYDSKHTSPSLVPVPTLRKTPVIFLTNVTHKILHITKKKKIIYPFNKNSEPLQENSHI